MHAQLVVRIRPVAPDTAQPVHRDLPHLRLGAEAAMLAVTQAGVELVIVGQSLSVRATGCQHLVRNLRLPFRAYVVLSFGDEDRHGYVRDEGGVH